MDDKIPVNIDYHDLSELKRLQRPPSLVLEVMQLVLLLMDSPDSDTTEWKAVANEICNKEMFEKMQNLDVSKITAGNVDKGKAMLGNIALDRVKRVSATAANLFVWAQTVLERC